MAVNFHTLEINVVKLHSENLTVVAKALLEIFKENPILRMNVF